MNYTVLKVHAFGIIITAITMPCTGNKKGEGEASTLQGKLLKNVISIPVTYFMEKDSPVILPVIGSRNASFKQQSVGGPTSYLIPTVFTNSCSWSEEAWNSIILTCQQQKYTFQSEMC